MRNLKKFSKYLLLIVIVAIVSMSLIGCAWIDDLKATIKGQLIGQEFEITTFDHQAQKTLTISGSKVTVNLLENSANFSADSTGFKSEVIEITINGDQMLQVGNTVIFEEKGLDMVTDFEVPKDVSATNGGGFVPMDRFVNDIKNNIGKPKTIVISSQLGIPIGVYQGEEVFVTIPSDLPKMTRINIDGKSLYIHRANYVILDTDLIQ